MSIYFDSTGVQCDETASNISYHIPDGVPIHNGEPVGDPFVYYFVVNESWTVLLLRKRNDGSWRDVNGKMHTKKILGWMGTLNDFSVNKTPKVEENIRCLNA